MSEDEMPKQRLTKKSPKISMKKFRTRCSSTVKELFKENGVFHSNLNIYRPHWFHWQYLWKNIVLKMFSHYVQSKTGTHLLTNRDHLERYQPAPDGEFQTEHFDKHQSLSMERCTASYFNSCTNKESVVFYSHLSDEKRQDAGTVGQTTRVMSNDLLEKKELERSKLKVLVSVVDGCAVQYRSGYVCYELYNLAIEFNMVCDRII